MAYTGKKPIDHTDVTQSQSMTVTDDLTVEGGTVDINGNELVLDADGDTSITSDTDDQIDFRTAGADRWQILSNGNLKAATNGLGIDFSASEGSGASSSVLDDYEEGTITLAMGGGTSNPSSTQATTGYYTKVGNFVTIWFRFSNRDNTGASGIVEVDGLPFTVTSGQDAYGVAWGGRDSAGDTGSKVWLAQAGTTSVKMITGGGNNINWASTGTGTYQGGVIHYRAS